MVLLIKLLISFGAGSLIVLLVEDGALRYSLIITCGLFIGWEVYPWIDRNAERFGL